MATWEIDTNDTVDALIKVRNILEDIKKSERWVKGVELPGVDPEMGTDLDDARNYICEAITKFSEVNELV